MLADQLDFIVGVDPHRDEHALAVVHVLSGAVVFETTVLANGAGYADVLKLVDVHASGRRAFAVEGTGSFGAGLTRFLTGGGERVLEVGRLRRERRSGGKTDALDAIRAARSVLTQKRPATPRASGEREPLRALMAAREGAVNAKRAGLCQLQDLLGEPLLVDRIPKDVRRSAADVDECNWCLELGREADCLANCRATGLRTVDGGDDRRQIPLGQAEMTAVLSCCRIGDRVGVHAIVLIPPPLFVVLNEPASDRALEPWGREPI
jgi:hypothetical protein